LEIERAESIVQGSTLSKNKQSQESKPKQKEMIQVIEPSVALHDNKERVTEYESQRKVRFGDECHSNETGLYKRVSNVKNENKTKQRMILRTKT